MSDLRISDRGQICCKTQSRVFGTEAVKFAGAREMGDMHNGEGGPRCMIGRTEPEVMMCQSRDDDDRWPDGREPSSRPAAFVAVRPMPSRARSAACVAAAATDANVAVRANRTIGIPD